MLIFTIGFGASALHQRSRQRSAVKVSINLGPQSNHSKATFESLDYVEGRYTNFDYAYSVLVPKGMMASTDPAPNPQHGFGIDLLSPSSVSRFGEQGRPHADLWVNAEYNTLELKSYDEAINQAMEFKRNDHGNVRLIRKVSTSLGGLPAVRFQLAYKDSGREMVEDQLVCFRHQDEIIYSIQLQTPVFRYGQDRQLISEIQRTWLVDPLPENYPLPPVYDESHP